MVSAVICLLLAAVAPAAYTQKTLYLDGSYVADTNAGSNSGLTFNDNILVGAEGTPTNLYNEYRGSLDEFAVYNGILDPNRILAHYTAKSTSYAVYSAAVSADSPLLWLKFDDGSVADGATAANSGSSATNGNYVDSGTTMSQVTGICGGTDKALDMGAPASGADGHAVVVPDNGEFGADTIGDTNTLTAEIWVKFTNYNPGDDSDWARFCSHGNGYTIMVSGPNQLGLYGGGTENYMTLPYDINDGQWHHVVVTYQSDYYEEPFVGGGDYDEEVLADNPVAWLRFDEEAVDSSGNDHFVAYGPATHIVQGVAGIGGTILLDEASGYVAVVSHDTNAPPLEGEGEDATYEVFNDAYAFAPNDISFEFWFKSLPSGDPQPDSSGRLFQQHGHWQNEPNGPGMKLNGTTQTCVYGGSGTSYRSDVVIDGEWHHIVVTYDEEYNGNPDAMQALEYIDGELRQTINFTSTSTRKAHLGTELSHIVIGAAGDYGGGNYNITPGYWDEFAVYEGILDPNRIMIHYSAWFPSNCAELYEKGGAALPPAAIADINKDCNVNFLDFAHFALNWMLCNDPASSDPDCVPNW